MEVPILALFSGNDLLARYCGQLALDEVLDVRVAPTAEAPVMPVPWELLPGKAITGQGVLDA